MDLIFANIYSILGFSSGVLTLIGLVVYGKSIFSGPTRPARVTWFIWALNALLLLVSYRASGSEETTWIAAAYVVGLLGIAFLAVKHGEGGWALVDKLCLVGTALAILLWVITGTPWVAFAASLLIDLCGVVPTIIHAWKYPQKEDTLAWGLMFCGAILSLFAMESWATIIVLYPLQLTVTTALILAFLFRKKKEQILNPIHEIRRYIERGIEKTLPSAQKNLQKLSFEIPPSYIHADYSFSTFFISEALREDPQYIAEKIVKYFSQESIPYVEKIFSAGPYVNIMLNRNAFFQSALTFIVAQGKKFDGMNFVQEGSNTSNICFQYFWFHKKEKLDINDLRVLLAGKVLATCFQFNNNILSEVCYSVDPNTEKLLRKINTSLCQYVNDQDYTEQSIQVAQDVIDKQLGRSVSGSQALWVDGTNDVRPFVLRRHDGTETSMARYLGYVRAFFLRKDFSEILCFSDGPDILNELLSAARYLGYIPSDLKVHPIAVGHIKNKNASSWEEDVRYRLLRTPLHNTISDEEMDSASNQYVNIKKVIQRLASSKNCRPTLDDGDLIMIKKLVIFPEILYKAKEHHTPSTICTYLEDIASHCEKFSVHEKKELASAASIVLNRGLSVLLARTCVS